MEAVIIIPFFIIAVVMMITIIPITATCENIVFEVTDEMHIESVKSAFRHNSAIMPLTLNNRIKKENLNINDYRIKSLNYLFSKNGIDDLISIKFKASFNEKNPLGLFNVVNFDGRVMARSFSGTYYKGEEISREVFENSKEKITVYIFPNWGERYHGKGCTYLKKNSMFFFLSQDMKKKYRPCRLCGAKKAQLGNPVFCFLENGKAYHLNSCKKVKKYYIEIEKKAAIDKGYKPCIKCGGD